MLEQPDGNDDAGYNVRMNWMRHCEITAHFDGTKLACCVQVWLKKSTLTVSQFSYDLRRKQYLEVNHSLHDLLGRENDGNEEKIVKINKKY